MMLRLLESHVARSQIVPTRQPKLCDSELTLTTMLTYIREVRECCYIYCMPSNFAFLAAWKASAASAKGCCGLQSGRTIISDGFRFR